MIIIFTTTTVTYDGATTIRGEAWSNIWRVVTNLYEPIQREPSHNEVREVLHN